MLKVRFLNDFFDFTILPFAVDTGQVVEVSQNVFERLLSSGAKLEVVTDKEVKASRKFPDEAADKARADAAKAEASKADAEYNKREAKAEVAREEEKKATHTPK